MVQRARVRFSRTGVAVENSHLRQIDLIRNALKESPWAVCMTEGRRPKPKASFGPAIAVGYESEAEFVDVELSSRLDFKKAKEQLQPHMPKGYEVMNVKSIPRYFPSVEESVNLIVYDVSSYLLQGTEAHWESFEKLSEFNVLKKKKGDEEIFVDARPCVRQWQVKGSNLHLELRIGPGRTLKPEKIIQAVCQLKDEQMVLGKEEKDFHIIRKRMCLEKNNGELIDL